MTFPDPPPGGHNLAVAADAFVVVLSCSCGWRTECDDDEVPLDELVRYAEDHRHAAGQQEEALAHLREGHYTRMNRTAEGMAMVCSCGYRWPVEVIA